MIAELPGVSLDELDERASLQRRVDNKYAIDADAFIELVRTLHSDHQVLEIDGRREFRYQSVYFDTPELRCFHDHIDDRRPRFKVRTRHYRDTGKCVFEVKIKRGDGETDKRQIDHDSAADELDNDARECLRAALVDADCEPPEQSLASSLRTSFTRITLAPATGVARTTCDMGIELTRPDGRQARLKEGFVVVESKSEDGEGPTDRVLAALGQEPISLSKYRTGIALLADEAHDSSRQSAQQLFDVR
jgi:hypothetical protein